MFSNVTIKYNNIIFMSMYSIPTINNEKKGDVQYLYNINQCIFIHMEKQHDILFKIQFSVHYFFFPL
jgi:hypothetical protein